MPYDGARGQMKDTAAGGIHATQGTFSSISSDIPSLSLFRLIEEDRSFWIRHGPVTSRLV